MLFQLLFQNKCNPSNPAQLKDMSSQYRLTEFMTPIKLVLMSKVKVIQIPPTIASVTKRLETLRVEDWIKKGDCEDA